MRKYLLSCAWLVVMFVMTVDARALDTAEAEIIQVLKNQFDRPVNSLEVPVVVVSGDYAVADWLQDNRGGRALLRHDVDGWHTQMCSGAQFKSVQVLLQAGVPSADAERISQDLAVQESNLIAEQLKKIDSFQGIVDMLTQQEHHHEHH
jgi:hypothetical protein